jgi:hypothetical protein
VGARDFLVRKRLLIEDIVEVLDDVFEVLVCDEEAENVFEDADELVLYLRVAETAERKWSLNAILRIDLPYLPSKVFPVAMFAYSKEKVLMMRTLSLERGLATIFRLREGYRISQTHPKDQKSECEDKLATL